MGRKATTIEEQIRLLESRGMNIDVSIEKAKEVLLDIGYYRLGFYWNPFEINSNHDFKKETKFSDVLSLYYLDVDLRNILLKYTHRIEINFRTQIIYHVSNQYPLSPTWFIDPKVIKQDFIKDISKYYNSEFIENNKTLKNHHIKYINDRYAPAWKTLEFFTFGVVLKLYCNLQDDKLKTKIGLIYGLKKSYKFQNLMYSSILLRNICSHGGVLFDFSTPKGIEAIPNLSFNSNNRHSLDSLIKVITFLLGTISTNRAKELSKDIDVLFAKYKHNQEIREIIEQKIGYIYS